MARPGVTRSSHVGRTVPGVTSHCLVIVNILSRAFLASRLPQVTEYSSARLLGAVGVRTAREAVGTVARSPGAGPSRTTRREVRGPIRAPGEIIMRSHHHQSHPQFSSLIARQAPCQELCLHYRVLFVSFSSVICAGNRVTIPKSTDKYPRPLAISARDDVCVPGQSYSMHT